MEDGVQTGMEKKEEEEREQTRETRERGAEMDASKRGDGGEKTDTRGNYEEKVTRNEKRRAGRWRRANGEK